MAYDAHFESPDRIALRLGPPTAGDTLQRMAQLQAALAVQRPQWLKNMSFGFGRVALHVRPSLVSLSQVIDCVDAALAGSDRPLDQAEPLIIPTCYDPKVGLDLSELAERLALRMNDIIELHAQPTYRVWATGFAPGFGYLGETDAALHLPRRREPRRRIAPGSVAIAENQTVVYPAESPGGWHLIGRTMCSCAVSRRVNSQRNDHRPRRPI